MMFQLRTLPPARCQSLSTRSRPANHAQIRKLSLAYHVHVDKLRDVDPKQNPIIIMHGLFGSKQNNRSISKALARDLRTRVYAIDLRNHGDSPHNPTHDYLAMAEDLEEFITEHGLHTPTLIGHSMGAKVAMTTALRRRSEIGALIAVDNAPVDAVLTSEFPRYIQGMRRILDAKVTKQAEADNILKSYEESVPIRQFLLTNLVRSRDSHILRFRVPIPILGNALGNLGDFPFKNPEKVRYEGSTLMVRGTKSQYVPDDVLPIVGRFFPCFELRDIECGHWVISEKPEAFKQTVIEFLQHND